MNAPVNPLVDMSTSDTLNNCRHLLSFIAFSMFREDAGKDVVISEDAREGLFHLLDTVGSALAHEERRTSSNAENRSAQGDDALVEGGA